MTTTCEAFVCVTVLKECLNSLLKVLMVCWRSQSSTDQSVEISGPEPDVIKMICYIDSKHYDCMLQVIGRFRGTFFNQSVCSISAKHSNAKFCLWHQVRQQFLS